MHYGIENGNRDQRVQNISIRGRGCNRVNLIYL